MARGMSKEQMLAIFLLAGIAVSSEDELPNQYWPRVPDYQQLRDESPWWLVHTEYGMFRIGWRKRVISISWERSPIRAIVTEDQVTKDNECVHAYSYAKAVEYLTEFKRIAEAHKEQFA